MRAAFRPFLPAVCYRASAEKHPAMKKTLYNYVPLTHKNMSSVKIDTTERANLAGNPSFAAAFFHAPVPLPSVGLALQIHTNVSPILSIYMHTRHTPVLL